MTLRSSHGNHVFFFKSISPEYIDGLSSVDIGLKFMLYHHDPLEVKVTDLKILCFWFKIL